MQARLDRPTALYDMCHELTPFCVDLDSGRAIDTRFRLLYPRETIITVKFVCFASIFMRAIVMVMAAIFAIATFIDITLGHFRDLQSDQLLPIFPSFLPISPFLMSMSV